MKDELRLEIPNGYITFRMEMVLKEGSLRMVRKVFRMIRDIPDREKWLKDICEYLERQKQEEWLSRNRKRYEKVLREARTILEVLN